ncbi:unnamed protein product, partial [Larinioides sclopetarius]
FGEKNNEETLNSQKSKLFQNSIVKYNFNLASLPPITTAASAYFHCAYTYCTMSQKYCVVAPPR